MDYKELYISGLSIPQVSEKTGIPRSTVRFRLKKAGLLRTRADGVQMAGNEGRLGSGMRGKKREFSDEWKLNISKSKSGKGLGYSLKPNGYIEITMGENKGRGQHVVVMESIIGRRLYANECVHHINGKRDDNRPENLELMTRSEHASHHAKESYINRQRTEKGRFK